MHIVTVLFKIHPAHYSEFVIAIKDNAQASLSAEPGCHQFDVCEGSDAQKPEIFLYEVYASKEAFQAHLAMPHFAQFNTLTAPWVADKTVAVFERILPSTDKA
jgi:(4S)-4-hydroxy-5-phosphonooxypentane-2,3-dione isomerase